MVKNKPPACVAGNFGKFLSGGLTDLIGGRRAFLLGTAGAVCCTALFGVGRAFPVFTLAWGLNRLLQSMGWPGAVKLASRWFSYSSYGAAMGFISLSYLFGDAAARRFMGWLIERGVGWRGVFFAAAGVMLVILIFNLLLLKESPKDVGEPEPKDNPLNLVAANEASAQLSMKSLLAAFLRSPAFLIVCALSLGCTLLRETFNTWTPTYFTEVAGLSKAEAASRSALFPFFGGVSVLLAGFVSDKLGRNGRAMIILWHERVGARWLARYFPEAVTEPIRLHVAAKRYLCAVDAEYQRQLSPASIQSLALQGGPMSEDEVRAFEAMPFVHEAVRLRQWDDQAKVVGWDVPRLAQYQFLLERLAEQGF